MADTVSTQIIQNSQRNIIVKFTNLSDGTGESGVKKIDATSTGPYGVSYQNQTFYPGIHLTVWMIEYDVKAMGLRIQWDATSAQDMVNLGPENGRMKYDFFAGLTVPVITGATGSILFTTTGAMPNSSYSVVMHLKKNVPVS